MFELINNLTVLSTAFLILYAGYSIFNSVKLSREKYRNSLNYNAPESWEQLKSLVPIHSDEGENPKLTREKIINAMRYALFEKYEFKQKRGDRILQSFHQFGTPDLIVTTQPINKKISILYSLNCNAFSPFFSNKGIGKSQSISILGSEWYPEKKNDFYSSYIFSPNSGGDERQHSIAHAIGLVMLRLYTTELLISKKDNENVDDITGYYDFIWGLDEPEDLKQFLHLFPSKSKELANEWNIQQLKDLEKSSNRQ